MQLVRKLDGVQFDLNRFPKELIEEAKRILPQSKKSPSSEVAGELMRLYPNEAAMISRVLMRSYRRNVEVFPMLSFEAVDTATEDAFIAEHTT